MALKAIFTYDRKTKDVDTVIWREPGEPPPLVKPKMMKKRKRGRPAKIEKPDVQ